MCECHTINNQVLNKIKIVVRKSSRKGCKYNEI